MIRPYHIILYAGIMLLSHLAAWGAQLQYHAETLRVTGFSMTQPIPSVSGYVVATVPDNFLTTVAGLTPACQTTQESIRFLIVTSQSPLIVQAPADLQCFDGAVVETKVQLDHALLQVVRARLPEFRAYVAEQCPIVDVTPRCQRFRAVAQRLDPSADDIDTLIQQALTIRSQLP